MHIIILIISTIVLRHDAFVVVLSLLQLQCCPHRNDDVCMQSTTFPHPSYIIRPRVRDIHTCGHGGMINGNHSYYEAVRRCRKKNVLQEWIIILINQRNIRNLVSQLAILHSG